MYLNQEVYEEELNDLVLEYVDQHIDAVYTYRPNSLLLRTHKDELFKFYDILIRENLTCLSKKFRNTTKFTRALEWLASDMCELACTAVGLDYTAVRRRVLQCIQEQGYFTLTVPDKLLHHTHVVMHTAPKLRS